MPFQADLHHVICALSDALDLVGIDDVGHGKRVGVMVAECGRLQGLPEAETAGLFDLGLLHDVGVSSTQVHRHLVDQFEWPEAQQHCDAGARLLSGYAPLAHLALPVRFHHTRWDQLRVQDLDPAVARRANLVFLADRADALLAPFHRENAALAHAREVREAIRARSGTCFAPDLVELFLEASRSEAFWLLLEPRAIQCCLQDFLARRRPCPAGLEDLHGLAWIFAHIVDAKSPFTATHSLGVAGVARLLAERLGLDGETCGKVEIAGLLHDLGKLRVPDGILEKPAPLNPRERQAISAHSFETYQILRRIPGFEEIAPWAAYHHEEPGGTGYPFRLRGELLPLEARVMRVADIFQAMAQDRPYRPGLPAGRVLGFLRGLAARNRLDAGILGVAAEHLDETMAAARPE